MWAVGALLPDGASLGINIRREDPDFAHLAVLSAANHMQYCSGYGRRAWLLNSLWLPEHLSGK